MRLPQNAPPKKSFQVPRHLVVALVAIIAVLFATVLWFVYPKSHMHKDESDYGAKPDDIAIVYLRHEVEEQPKNRLLRLKLIRQELHLGNLDRVSDLLKPILNRPFSGKLMWQFKWYAFQVEFLRMTGKDAKKGVAKHSLASLTKSMQALVAASLTNAQMITLARQAVEIKAYTLVKQLSKKLLLHRSQLTYDQLTKVGRYSYLAADFLRSTQCYMAAFNKAHQLPEKKQAYLNAIDSLLAGNLLPKHFPLVLRDSSLFKNDPEVLAKLARAALASGQYKLATQWMRQAIGLDYSYSGKGV